MASQWVPPLPAGYEARWDPNQRAYFFINHADKSTTWSDPRFSPAVNQHQQAAQSLNQGGYHSTSNQDSGGGSVAMSTMYRQFGGTTTIKSSDDSGESDAEWSDQSFGQLFPDHDNRGNQPVNQPRRSPRFDAPLNQISENQAPGTSRDSVNQTAVNKTPVSQAVANRAAISKALVTRRASMNKDSNQTAVNQTDVNQTSVNQTSVNQTTVNQTAVNKAPIPKAVVKKAGPKDSKKSEPGRKEQKVDQLLLQELRQSFPSAPDHVVEELLKTSKNNKIIVSNKLFASGYKHEMVHHPRPKGVDMLERLLCMFPDADREIVKELLEACDNDEKEARKTLVECGYTARYPETHRNPSATGARGSSPAKKTTSPPKAPSPKKAKSPVRATSPANPKLTDAQKSQMVAKMQKAYPKHDKSVIEMALDVCNFDLDRSKACLERMWETEQNPSVSRPGTSHSNRSISPTPVVTSTSFEPVSLFDDIASRPSTSKSRTTTPGVRFGSDSASRASSAAKTAPKKSTQPRPTHQTRAKQVTHQRRPVVSQPNGTGYMSSYRTQAKGPDPSLHHGPNKDLLIREYVTANGPNTELRQGPDPSRVQGSRGSVGPDRSLHCGPQYHLRQGPDPMNRQGCSV